MADPLQQRDAAPVRFKLTPLQRRVAAIIEFSPDDGRKNVAERLLDVLMKIVLPVVETIDKSETPGVEATEDALKALPGILDELIAAIGPGKDRQHLIYWKLAELMLAMQFMPVPVDTIERILMEHVRARKKAKAADPEAVAAKATKKSKDLERLVPIVQAACVLAGRNPAQSDQCVRDIRPHLPKEDHRLSFVRLKEALGLAKLRLKKTPPPATTGGDGLCRERT